MIDKRSRIFIHISVVVIILGMLAVFNGCPATSTTQVPASFAETQYKALAASQELYNMSWGGFVQLYKTKVTNKAGNLLVTEARYQEGLKYATTYYETWMAWLDTVIQYEKMKAVAVDNKVPVEQAMLLCQKAATDLMKLIQPYLQEGGAK